VPPAGARVACRVTTRPSRKQTLLSASGGRTGSACQSSRRLSNGHTVADRLRRRHPDRTLLGERPSSNWFTPGRRTVPGTRNRRDTLLAAALNSFTQRGYDATSVAELAAATGMSKAAVSYHFRTKNDLLHAVADPLLDSLDALVDRHPTAPHWPGGVRALLEDYLTTLTNHSQVAAWVDSDKAVLNHPQIGVRLHHNTERMCQAITGSTADGTAATARATAALGSLWRPIRTLSPAQLATHRDALLHTAMAGCAPTHTPLDPPPPAT
jgi:AcrR family transcriptional regulator